tara:strand:- start:1940 stop:2596 length:657 start_codon:yes stop_codon:yes gene_type:complete
MVDFTQARQNMINSQLRTNEIADEALIDAFFHVPREVFVEPKLQGVAYTDNDISVGLDRYLIAPMIFGRLLQALNAQPEEVALDIGCGTGYSSAVLAQLVTTVVALESEKQLALTAEKNFHELAVDNAVLVEGLLEEGYATQGPYDIINFSAGIPFIPSTLKSQLSDGGRLCAVVMKDGGIGKAVLMTNRNGIFSEHILFEAHVATLPGFKVDKGFKF